MVQAVTDILLVILFWSVVLDLEDALSEQALPMPARVCAVFIWITVVSGGFLALFISLAEYFAERMQ